MSEKCDVCRKYYSISEWYQDIYGDSLLNGHKECITNIIGRKTAVRPPVGLRPRYIAEEMRLQEIEDAIMRYKEACYSIPNEWVVEYIELKFKMSKENLQMSSEKC